MSMKRQLLSDIGNTASVQQDDEGNFISAKLAGKDVKIRIFEEKSHFQIVAEGLFNLVKIEEQDIDSRLITGLVTRLLQHLQKSDISVYKHGLFKLTAYTFEIDGRNHDDEIFSVSPEELTDAVTRKLGKRQYLGKLTVA